MRLCDLLQKVSCGYLIGTEGGNGWLYYHTTSGYEVTSYNFSEDMFDREVINIYYCEEGREANGSVIALEPALRIIIEGEEGGNI